MFMKVSILDGGINTILVHFRTNINNLERGHVSNTHIREHEKFRNGVGHNLR